jgi:phage-related protein
MVPKPLLWLGTARSDVRNFPEIVRGKVGHELFQIQQGLTPSDWKPMTSVGPGVMELRIHAGGAFRVIYLARHEEGVYVLHAFEKRSRQTRTVDIELAQKRLRDLIRSRSRR